MQVDRFWNMKKVNDVGELYLYGPISSSSWWDDEVSPKKFKKELDGLKGVKVLNVYINSGGGDVFAGQAIHSMLRRFDAKVHVYIDGLAASIASVIAMAGDKVIMPRNTMMMIHNPWALGVGNANELRKLAEDLDKVRESIIAAYEEKTSLSRDKIIEMLDEETWLTAEEAKELGFADEIIPEKNIAASIQNGQLVFNGEKLPLNKLKNLPGLLKRIPNAHVAFGIQNKPEKEESLVPKTFDEVLASLPEEQQSIVKNYVDGEIAKLQEQLNATLQELNEVKNKLQQYQTSEQPSEEEFLASLPEPLRAKYMKEMEEAQNAKRALAEAQEKAEIRDFIDKVKVFDKLPIKAEEFGPMMRIINKSDPKIYDYLMHLLAAVNNVIEDSELFKQIGSDQEPSGQSAYSMLEARAHEISKQEGISFAKAFVKACHENPELYARYQKEEL